MRRISVMLGLLLLLASILVYGQPSNLQLPFMAGDTWWCAQGWNGSVSHSGEAAWDYDFSNPTDLGYPLLAALDGDVVFAGRSKKTDGANSKYGNVVLIDFGNGYYGRLAHLNDVIVKNGEHVVAGQVVGFCGTTGETDTQWPSHIHFNSQRTSNPSDKDYTEVNVHYMDYLGQTSYGYPDPCDCSSNPPADKYYTSLNSNILNLEFNANGGYANYGSLQNGVGQDIRTGIHWYHAYDPGNLYRGGNVPNNCYVQNWGLANGLITNSTLYYSCNVK